MRAGSVGDAISQWRKLVGDDSLALDPLRMVVNGRTVRRLCQICKVAYTPDPEQLRKLNLDPKRAGTLYQARSGPLRDKKGRPLTCPDCSELMFKGRLGVYEILPVDDEVRQVLSEGGAIAQLRTLFRKRGGRYMQEMALAHVEAGETSVSEVSRVMKAADAAASSSSSHDRVAAR
jgi:type II secretory ATPase GspE/PulE/Tfp pilus assembly ATPase PilB-like protein